MIDYISGKIQTLMPTAIVIDNHGIGYSIEISLQTYGQLEGKEEGKLFIQSQVNQRDGTEIDYGFATIEERNLFRMITSVSGMGAATARIILSSMTAEELRDCILSENVNRLKSIKGIGLKSAQRMILELKDKVVKGTGSEVDVLALTQRNDAMDEAIRALTTLGFSKPNVIKAIQKIQSEDQHVSLEEIIKKALKML